MASYAYFLITQYSNFHTKLKFLCPMFMGHTNLFFVLDCAPDLSDSLNPCLFELLVVRINELPQGTAMPSYLHTGVYIKEIPSGSRPIEGVGTSTAAFIGYSTQGPIGEPELIFKWNDYDKRYGGIRVVKLFSYRS